MATIKTIPFNKWWRAIKRKEPEQQRDIFTKWLHYACKTIAHRGDMNQARVVYTIATRFNKSEYKRITRANAERVYRLVNLKQQTHRKQVKQIMDLEERVKELETQLAKAQAGHVSGKNVADAIMKTNKNVHVTVKKHRKIITGGKPQ